VVLLTAKKTCRMYHEWSGTVRWPSLQQYMGGWK